MTNLTKYKISYFFETFFSSLTFLCLGGFCFTDDISLFYSSIIWLIVYTLHYFCFSSRLFSSVYKVIEEEKEEKKNEL